ncbi:MAG: O-antigen ligase family protein [Actinobacteria bacterium]|nr:O-antigen ligase family protein [Actinomycetota bacterium]
MVALTTAVMAQGAFYQPTQLLVGAVLGAALLAGIGRRPALPLGEMRAVLLAGGFLAAWAVASAGLAGDARRATGVVCLLAGVAIVMSVAGRGDGGERDMLAAVAMGLGALQALAGWIGVAWHVTPLALVDQGLWRAAGTITYANAAAGLLAPLALVSLGHLVRRPCPRRAGVACLMLVGLGATLSRGGLIAFIVGLVVLTGALGWRRLVAGATAPLLGAALALGALAPSMAATGPAHPLLAVGGLVLGLVLAARVEVRVARPAASLGLVALVSAGGLAALGRAGRLTLSSSDRVGEAAAALSLAADHPIAGVGPGWRSFEWTGADGYRRVAEFVHNEYLQVLAEMGVVGLALLVGLLVAVGTVVWRGRSAASSTELWAGVAGGLVAVVIHAASDFGWHVPAVPLASALLVGIVMQPPKKETAP